MSALKYEARDCLGQQGLNQGLITLHHQPQGYFEAKFQTNEDTSWYLAIQCLESITTTQVEK